MLHAPVLRCIKITVRTLFFRAQMDFLNNSIHLHQDLLCRPQGAFRGKNPLNLSQGKKMNINGLLEMLFVKLLEITLLINGFQKGITKCT